ncbi:MAG: SPFH domain-containing protein [Chloroflexota bacterium]|nr:SPFH domain-containing protein [Dehalococcoidia bacterium]MDW8253313.1 SPFH domain-containing protein [Chloroflexota bacterium]
MAILDVIEFVDPSGQEIVRRVPEVGSGEFRLGSQLIVRENQAAIFFRDGKALDSFGPGRHTLSTNNIPLLANLLALPFGGRSPFRAEVYFVSLREFVDLKWGTPEPIPYRDTELGMVRLRAFGSYAMAVSNPMLFVNKVVGGQGLFTTAAVTNYLRGIIVASLTDLLGETMKSIFDLPSLYDEIAAATRARVQDAFAALGLELRALNVQAITPPEDVQKAIDQRAGMGAIGLANMTAYLQYQAAQAMREAAQNPAAAGSGATEGLGLGAGIGLGAAMAGMISQAVRPGEPPATAQPAAAPSATTVCPSCRAQIPAAAKFCPECGVRLSASPRCPQCGAEAAAGAKFCAECGIRLAS